MVVTVLETVGVVVADTMVVWSTTEVVTTVLVAGTAVPLVTFTVSVTVTVTLVVGWAGADEFEPDPAQMPNSF